MGITIQSLLQTHVELLTSTRRLSKEMWNAALRLSGCRTSAMGIHVRRCPDYHVSSIAYNSCRHRCCQVCGGLERERWLHRWKARLLPCPHHHAVFTIPHELLDLWRYNKPAIANMLFAAASQTLRQLLADSKYCGGRAGLLAALHTWSQTLAAHVHLHVLVTAGGLDANQRWQPAVKKCLLPRKVLMIVFRGKCHFRLGIEPQLNFDELDGLMQDVKAIAQSAVNSGTAIHTVEKQLLDKLLQLGHAALGAMFQSVGHGDVGETLLVPEHTKPLNRYPELSKRTYRSIFGDFELSRYLYGKSPTNKSLAIPLDEHFGLPPSRFSLLLESWVSQLSTSEPIHEAMDKLHDIVWQKM